eukprot:1160501-Pelagomonas_calceolata.AAC.10
MQQQGRRTCRSTPKGADCPSVTAHIPINSKVNAPVAQRARAQTARAASDQDRLQSHKALSQKKNCLLACSLKGGAHVKKDRDSDQDRIDRACWTS